MTKRRVDNPLLIEKRLPQIIEASTKEFAKRGFHATTVQDIAGSAGISVGMIYQYVEDKLGLLYLVITEIVTAYEEEVECNRRDPTDGLQKLCDLIFGLGNVVATRKAAARLGYSESRYLNRRQLEEVKRRERQLGAYIAALIEACINENSLRPVNAQLLAYQCLIFVQSWAVSAWRIVERITCEQYVSDGLKLILGGVVIHDELHECIANARRRQQTTFIEA